MTLAVRVSEKHRKLVHPFSGLPFLVYNFSGQIDVLQRCTPFFRVDVFGVQRCDAERRLPAGKTG
jgi:hypothetical protein